MTSSVATNGAVDAPSVSRSTVADADGYESSVAGIAIEALRAGPGSGENSVLAVREDRFISSSCRIGFPMFTRTNIGDDRVILAQVWSAGPGSRWCEIDLEPGDIIAYGPGAAHAAVNNPGLGFTFAITTLERLEAQAEELRLKIEGPERGRVQKLAPAPKTREVGVAFSALTEAAAGGHPTRRLADEVLRSMAGALSTNGTEGRTAPRQKIDPRRLVHACTDYVEASGRLPSIDELRSGANASERTLRRAFLREFGLPPSQFFRVWALEEARRRLRDADEGSETVTRVAFDLGFSHLGRFAGNYRGLHGESPSATLRIQPSS